MNLRQGEEPFSPQQSSKEFSGHTETKENHNPLGVHRLIDVRKTQEKEFYFLVFVGGL